MQNRYTLTQVARLTSVSVSTLMRWEQRGWIAAPLKRAPRTNARIYTDADIAAIIHFRDEGHQGPSQSLGVAEA